MLERVEDVVRSTSGRQVGYMLRGPVHGRVVVYLHGMPSWRREQLVFPDSVVERLALRLLSVDRPGWGNTDPLAGDRAARVADVISVCDALGVATFPILAVSAGGSYALTLAAVELDRVERVVLAAAAMPYDDEGAIQGLRPDRLALLPILRNGRTPELIEGVEAWRQSVLAEPSALFESALQSLSDRERVLFTTLWFRDALFDAMREGLRVRVDGALDDLLTWPTPFEVDLSAIRCPVVAFHGTHDDWAPLPNLRRILDRLSNAQLIAAEGLNHFAPSLYPELVLALAG
jgi:pimeloyl-ACP methyl ester carboxylesterase